MKQIKILNIQSKALNLSSLVSTIDFAIKSQPFTPPVIIGSINLHALYIHRNNLLFQKFYDSIQFCYVDGMPIIWMLKALGHNISSDYRITVLDWHEEALELANAKNLTVALLGSGEGIAKLASERLARKYENINFIFHHGYITNDEIPKIIEHNEIDLLLVGMGMPKEEAWILKNQLKLKSKVIIPVGGYFDYIAGKTYTPPRWAGKIGLEWFFRLITDPKRLASRYLLEPWPVFYHFVMSLVKTNK